VVAAAPAKRKRRRRTEKILPMTPPDTDTVHAVKMEAARVHIATVWARPQILFFMNQSPLYSLTLA
jgi:hypothetical protein